MPGPGGIEAGRASLKVLPNLTTFTASLRRFIQRIEKQVVIQLPTTLDPRGVTEGVEKVKERVRRSPAQIPVQPSKIDEFARKVRADVRAATRALEAQIPVTADGEQLRRDVAAQVAGIEKSLSVDVPMDAADAVLFRRKILDQVAAVQARVRADPVKIPVTYDERGLQAAVGRSRKDLRGLATGLSAVGQAANGRALSGRAALFTALGVSAAFSLPSVLSLAGGLSQVAGAAALLPAAVGAAGIGVAALAVGFHGVTDALKNMGDAEKFAEAMKGLSKPARDAVKAIQELGPAAKKMQLAVQSKLFAGMGKVIARVGGTYLPVMRQAFLAVATSANKAVKSVAGVLTSPQSIRDTSDALGFVAQAYQRMGTAPADLTRAMRDLSRVGAGFLPNLASGLASLTQRFAAYISAARSSGELSQFIATGLSSLRALAQVLGGAASALFGVVRAAQAAGGGTLQAFAGVLQRVAAVVNGPEFQAGLTTFFAGLQAGAAALASALPAIGGALAAMAPGLAALAVALGTGIGSALTLLAQGLVALAPTFNALATSLSTVNPLFLGIAVAIGAALPVLGSLVGTLGSVVGVLATVSAPVALAVGAIAALAAGFVLVYQNSQPVRDAVASVGAAVSAMWVVVQPIFAQLAAVVMQHWPQIAAVASQVWSTVQTVVVTALTVIRSVIALGTAYISAVWARSGDLILATVNRVFPAILTIIQGALNVIQGVFRAATAVMKGNWSGAWAAIRQIVTGQAQVIAGTVRALGGLLIGAFAAMGRGMRSAVSTAWSAVRAAFSAGTQGVVAVVRTLPGLVLSALGSLGGLLVGAGQAMVQGLINGIRGMAGQVAAEAGRLASNAVNAIKSKLQIHSPSRVMVRIGQFAGQGLVKGLSGSVSQVRSAAARLADTVAKALSHRQISRGRRDWISDRLTAGTRTLYRLAGQRAAVAVRLKAAQTQLAKAVQTRDAFAQTVRANIAQFGSITAAAQQGAGADQIVDGLKRRLAAIRAFAANLVALRKLGLNRTSYQELVQAGVEGGGQTAAALRAGGRAVIGQVNRLAAQITSQGNALGRSAASALYQAGVNSAQGLVDGLKSKAGALAAAADALARRIVATVRRALKIKSPSRVMVELGRYTGQGFADGLAASQALVDKQMASLSRAPRPGSRGTGSTAVGKTAAARTFQFGDVYAFTPEQLVRQIAERERRATALDPLFF